MEYISENHKIISELILWDRFIREGSNTTFLSKEEFESLLAIKDVVLNYQWTLMDNKRHPILRESNPQFIQRINQKFDRLTDLYNDRFKQTEQDFIIRERLYLFQLVGLFDVDILKGSNISNKTKHEIIAKIVNCNARAVKGFMNREEKYSPKQDEIKRIEKYYKTLISKE